MKHALTLALVALTGCASNDAPRGDVDPALLMMLMGRQQVYQQAPMQLYTPVQPVLMKPQPMPAPAPMPQPIRGMNCTSTMIGQQVHTNCF
jgi:hypothetical protein